MSNKIKIFNVVGTRPNFIKIAPLIQEMDRYPELISHFLIHTGQHYDKQMSREIFGDLAIPTPDIHLGIRSDSSNEGIVRIMMACEKLLIDKRPDLVLVVGDVNSTLAAALAAAKFNIPIAHVEAGLRSFNWAMPEELNRIITDRFSQFLFTTEKQANNNLFREGIARERIFFVGNVMVDALTRHYKKSKKSDILRRLKISKENFALLTFHRSENVDQEERLLEFAEIVDVIQKKIKVVFPIHPRTEKQIKKFNLQKKFRKMKNVILTEPLGYLDFLCLEGGARVVLTDSGGIQEETTVLNIPCLTLRNETERPITVSQGTNTIVGLDKAKISRAFKKISVNRQEKIKMPELWDGKTAQRIIKILLNNKDKFFS